MLICLTMIIYMEKAMAPHSSTLAWKIPWAEEPGRLQSMGSLRVGHDWATSLSLFTFMHWRRKWQPTPVFLTGECQGLGSPVGCHMGSHWVGHDWSDLADDYIYFSSPYISSDFCFMYLCFFVVRGIMVYDVYLCELYLLSLKIFIFVSFKNK